MSDEDALATIDGTTKACHRQLRTGNDAIRWEVHGWLRRRQHLPTELAEEVLSFAVRPRAELDAQVSDLYTRFLQARSAVDRQRAAWREAKLGSHLVWPFKYQTTTRLFAGDLFHELHQLLCRYPHYVHGANAPFRRFFLWLYHATLPICYQISGVTLRHKEWNIFAMVAGVISPLEPKRPTDASAAECNRQVYPECDREAHRKNVHAALCGRHTTKLHHAMKRAAKKQKRSKKWMPKFTFHSGRKGAWVS